MTTGPGEIIPIATESRKLPVGQPVVLIDHLRLQKRNDHETAAEDEQAGFEKEEEEFRDRAGDEEHDRVHPRLRRWRCKEQRAAEAGGDEHHGQLLLHDHGDGAGDDGERPRQAIGAQRAAPEVPAGFDDERDDGGSDSVEKRAQVPVGGELNVKPGRGRHDDEWRQAERDGGLRPRKLFLLQIEVVQ